MALIPTYGTEGPLWDNREQLREWQRMKALSQLLIALVSPMPMQRHAKLRTSMAASIDVLFSFKEITEEME